MFESDKIIDNQIFLWQIILEVLDSVSEYATESLTSLQGINGVSKLIQGGHHNSQGRL